MRSVFVFPSGEMAATRSMLDRLFDGPDGFWTDGNLYIKLGDEQDGLLFADWDPDDVRHLDTALGSHPSWAVQVDISGRIDGTTEVRNLLSHLLQDGGVAVDDYAAHCWTLQEIESELRCRASCYRARRRLRHLEMAHERAERIAVRPRHRHGRRHPLDHRPAGPQPRLRLGDHLQLRRGYDATPWRLLIGAV